MKSREKIGGETVRKWGVTGLSFLLLLVASACETEGQEAGEVSEESEDEVGEETIEESESLAELIEGFEPEEVDTVAYLDESVSPEEADPTGPVFILNFDERFPNVYGEEEERVPGVLEFRPQLGERVLIDHHLSNQHVAWLEVMEEIVETEPELIDLDDGIFALNISDLTIGSMLNKDYFLIVNKTEEIYRDFSVRFTVRSDSLGTIIENREVFLAAEHFGELEPYTVMPFYVYVDEEEWYDLSQATRENDTAIETHEVVNNADVPDEYEDGYPREYVNQYIGEEGEGLNSYNIGGKNPIFPHELPANLSREQLESLNRQLLHFKGTQEPHQSLEELQGLWPQFLMQPAGQEEIYVPYIVHNATNDSLYEIVVNIALRGSDGTELLSEEEVVLNEDTHEFGINEDEFDFPLLRYDEMAIVFLEIPSDQREEFIEAVQSDEDIHAELEVLERETLFDR